MSAPSNVHALPNASVPSDAPVEEIVSLLSAALEKAKSGKTIGIAFVEVERDPIANVFVFHTPQISTIGYHTAHMSRHSLMAGVMGMMWKLGQCAAEEVSE